MLKAKIVKGELKVLRGEVLMSQCCPRSQHPEYANNCGVHCPLFGEVISNNWHEDGTFREIAIKTFNICECVTFEVVE